MARAVRKNDKPFGGIQLILCGDFLQLPPIAEGFGEAKKELKFCFQTKAWQNCVQRYFELKRVHRQTDAEFIDILNSIRIGRVSQEIVDKLNATSKQKIEGNGILATRLCSHTADVNIINESKLSELAGESKVFEAQDSDKFLSKQLDAQTPVPSRLVLKVGAQVMLLKNINVSIGLVNGARGVVKEFKDGLPVVQFRNKEYVTKQERWIVKSGQGSTAVRVQIPLKLAWAFSIHKSQGLTLDCVEMSLARVFEAGQAYVALSRAQSLTTLRVLDFKASQVWANPNVLDFCTKLQRRIEDTKLIPLGRSEVRAKSAITAGKRAPLGKKFLSAPLLSIS